MQPTTRSCPSQTRGARASRRGLTLIEIIVVVTIIALVTGVAAMGSMQLPTARLRRSATMITSAIKVAYTRATATSRPLRLVFDEDRQKIWLEETDVPMLVQVKDLARTGGADPVTQAERTAVEESEGALKGPKVARPRFHPIEVYGFGDVEEGKGGRPLQKGIQFRAVQTTHDESPRTSGRAYLYFWPGGRTERASIQVRIGDSEEDSRTLTLVVAPLTGKVTVKPGPVDLQVPSEDSFDRMDTGF
ncbi:MAG TPA: prepilin-type N-terminal cleavage/methylation domain-containing protein [Polyangiaceae bacterium]|nr:prepilin-type N-terminal cleavage/methylation domain-containing protein [Polyangiaceae bacterium]